MGGIFDQYVQGIQQLVGGGTIAGKPGSPRVIMGPQVVGGQAIPWHNVSRASMQSGGARPRYNQTGSLAPLVSTNRPEPFQVSGTLFQPTGFHRYLRPEQAAVEYYAEGPGSEVVSAAPGAADLLRDLQAGFLPTLRNAMQPRAVNDYGQPVGPPNMVGGADPSGPPLVWLGAGAAAFLLVLVLVSRKGKR